MRARADRIQAAEPQIVGRPATEFMPFVFDRLACFVEEVTAHLLTQKLPALMALAEVPHGEPPGRRSEEVPADAGKRRNAAVAYRVSRLILRRIVISWLLRAEPRILTFIGEPSLRAPLLGGR